MSESNPHTTTTMPFPATRPHRLWSICFGSRGRAIPVTEEEHAALTQWYGEDHRSASIDELMRPTYADLAESKGVALVAARAVWDRGNIF